MQKPEASAKQNREAVLQEGDVRRELSSAAERRCRKAEAARRSGGGLAMSGAGRRLAGKTAVITGSSRGIGRETARLLAGLGCRVVLNGRSPDALERARREIASAGAAVVAVAGDVGDAPAAEALIRAAVESFGGVDILINNAGISMRGGFDRLAPQVLQQVVQTNILGALYPTLYALPELEKRRGSVLFVSSLAGLHGLPMVSVYSLSKMALTGLAQSLRAEVGHRGVHVGIVHVGFTENDPDKRVLAADGSLQPITRASHSTQRQAAGRIVAALLRRRYRTVLTPAGKLFALAARFFPAAVDRVMSRVARSSHSMYS
jgi:NAD(P)-dependent dehydrogenase (short-subunit alcohol dehydrogenase family)